jgi:hypothetical protein
MMALSQAVQPMEMRLAGFVWKSSSWTKLPELCANLTFL